MTTITQKGQVTIPKAVREVLRVKQGDEVVFEVEDEKVIVRRKDKTAHFRDYIGILRDKEGQKADNIVRRLRGE